MQTFSNHRSIISEKPQNNEPIFDMYWNIISLGPSSSSFRSLTQQFITQLIQYCRATGQQYNNYKNMNNDNEDSCYDDLIHFANTQGLNITKFPKDERSFEHHIILLGMCFE